MGAMEESEDTRRARIAWQMIDLEWAVISAAMSRAAIVTAMQVALLLVLADRVFANKGTLSSGVPHCLGVAAITLLAVALLSAADAAFDLRPARGSRIKRLKPPPLLDPEKFANWDEAEYFSKMVYNHGAVSRRLEDSVRLAGALTMVALALAFLAFANP
jgi:hypothetical protein